MSQSELRETLAEVYELLSRVGEGFWSKKIGDILEEERLDESSLSAIANWYGGMGSFNDLMICRINGHQVEAQEEGPINDQLDALRSRVYKLTQQR